MRADLSGGSISSHGGARLLREVGRRLGLTARVAGRIGDGRQRGKVGREAVTMLRRRVHGLAPGYEDRTDCLFLTLVPSILAAPRRAWYRSLHTQWRRPIGIVDAVRPAAPCAARRS